MGFLMISGGIIVNQFAYIRLILEAKFGDHPFIYLFYRIYDIQGAKQVQSYKGSLSEEGNLIKVLPLAFF